MHAYRSQNEEVLTHLLAGKTLTPIKALHVYGISRLAARVYELKKKGHDIITTIQKDEQGNAYAEYRLKVKDRFGRPKK